MRKIESNLTVNESENCNELDAEKKESLNIEAAKTYQNTPPELSTSDDAAEIEATANAAEQAEKPRKKGLKARAKQLKTDIPAVFLALKDKRTPFFAKILAALTLVYALSPIDLIPDFIPILGLLDDIIILPALIALTIKLIPKDIFAEYRQKSLEIWKEGKPKRWYFAIPFILIWALIVFLIVKAIWL